MTDAMPTVALNQDPTAWLEWAGRYDAYRLLASEPAQLERLLRPARGEYRSAGRVPAWCGEHLLRGWLFLLYRSDHFAGGYDLTTPASDQFQEWSAVVDALRSCMAAGNLSGPVDPTLFGLAEELDLDLVTTSPSPDTTDHAIYSRDSNYRYALARWWGAPDLEKATVWIGLNPATGDTDGKPRPTLAGCAARSKKWDHSGLLFLNLFAYRATNPKHLAEAADPVGPINDLVLERLSGAAGKTVAAWGGGGSLLGRSSVVASLLNDAQCLGTTRRGEPRHPLYVARSTPLSPWPTPRRKVADSDERFMGHVP